MCLGFEPGLTGWQSDAFVTSKHYSSIESKVGTICELVMSHGQLLTERK